MPDAVVVGLQDHQLDLPAERFFAELPWDGPPPDVESLPAAQFFNLL